MKYPHEAVLTRLQQSAIHGLGVFAILDIQKDTTLFPGDEDSETVAVPFAEVEKLPIRKMYVDFCPLNDGIYTCPKNFNQMTISWYLNSSKEPNVVCGEGLIFYAGRDIKAGEELTVDYDTYSE